MIGTTPSASSLQMMRNLSLTASMLTSKHKYILSENNTSDMEWYALIRQHDAECKKPCSLLHHDETDKLGTNARSYI